ncbi:hypothetical protein [uncultured Shewanella sp.]|uniref:hypothetical protein n=1 Tax=uncultured Shewanella sp. TaxID=173975 RepID=UPI00261F8F17|nr:hypothetical protein [uncultured Shewanella sp.]
MTTAFCGPCSIGFTALASANLTYYRTGSMRASLTSGAITGAMSAVFYGIGEAFTIQNCAACYTMEAGKQVLTTGARVAKTIAHGMAGGVIAAAQGGNFGSAFMAAGISQAFAPNIDGMGEQGVSFDFGRTAASAVLGGTASMISGGKFANGAITAAFARIFNDGMHAAKQRKIVIDSTNDALDHYITGNGETAELGPNTKSAIMNSDDQLYRLDRIRTGKTSSNKGNYSVDLEFDSWDNYHVGNTRIDYSTQCAGSTCSTTFTSGQDGFWDPIYDSDGYGPQGEFGTPFKYKSFQWTEVYPKP